MTVEIEPMCGKLDVMCKHLGSCQNVSSEVQQKAKDYLSHAKQKQDRNAAARILGKENIPPDFSGTAPHHHHSSTTSHLIPLRAHSSMATLISDTVSDTPTLAPSLSQVLVAGPDVSESINGPVQRTEQWAKQQMSRGSTDLPVRAVTAVAAIQKWPDAIQQQFAGDLCRLLIACNIAWMAVDHPYLRAFMAKWIPEAILPTRKALAGRVLDQESDKVVRDMRMHVKGRYATGQSDGWKNITKTSLVASMINVEFMVSLPALRQSLFSLICYIALSIECYRHICTGEKCGEFTANRPGRDSLLRRNARYSDRGLVYGFQR